MMMELSYRRHRFPPVVIQHAVWLYLRFTLSYRDVEDQGAEVRTGDRAAAAAGPPSPERSMASGRDGCSDRWQADVPLACRRSRSEVLDMLVQRRRDTRAALLVTLWHGSYSQNTKT